MPRNDPRTAPARSGPTGSSPVRRPGAAGGARPPGSGTRHRVKGPTGPRRGGRGLRLALAALLLAAAPIAAFLWIYTSELNRPVLAGGAAPPPAAPAGRLDPARVLEVRRGASFGQIARELARRGWIGRPWVARLEARRLGWDRRVFPGWYRPLAGETVRQFLARLGRGEIEQTVVTIPEGWRLERILATLADSAWVPLDEVRAAAADPAWLEAQGVPGPGLEGYLLPDTYRIARGTAPASILEQLLRPGREFWTDSLESPAARLGWNRRQVWTLASIVEAEAAVPQERARISAVFHNRLRLGMRLESDPTVLFGLGRPPGRVLYADLESASPYNTYRIAGLPPGPICSPGRASLRAAVRPDPACDDLFFVARGDGTHLFTRTLAEHNRARQLVRRRS